jgi:4'-phosphopantetheinyl transferase
MKQDNSRAAWSHPPGDLDLGSHQVDIWRVSLDLPPVSVKQMESTLPADESERASKFHFDYDRNRFTLAHASLRRVLARYLHIQPHRINFSVNEYGKPSLPPETEIHFNLSHSSKFALIAVSRNRNIGVDVEKIRVDIELENLASRYFSPHESSELLALPPEQRAIGFFNCWTRKEAYIKAQGLGLSLPLDSFDVSLTPAEPTLLRATRPDSTESARWTLLSLLVDTGYAGALAVEGKDLEFRYWDFIP